MQTLLQDFRYALRQLQKNPGFALTAVISLAFGIDATMEAGLWSFARKRP